MAVSDRGTARRRLLLLFDALIVNDLLSRSMSVHLADSASDSLAPVLTRNRAIPQTIRFRSVLSTVASSAAEHRPRELLTILSSWKSGILDAGFFSSRPHSTARFSEYLYYSYMMIGSRRSEPFFAYRRDLQGLNAFPRDLIEPEVSDRCLDPQLIQFFITLKASLSERDERKVPLLEEFRVRG